MKFCNTDFLKTDEIYLRLTETTEANPAENLVPSYRFEIVRSGAPAGRWGTPEDLMGPAVFLASDASDFVNGHVLYVDGGLLAYIGKQPE